MSASLVPNASEEGFDLPFIKETRSVTTDPTLQRRKASDSEFPSIVAGNVQIHSNLSKSMDNLCEEDSGATARQLDGSQRQLSLPTVNVCGCEEVGDSLTTTQNNREEGSTTVDRRSCKQSQKLGDGKQEVQGEKILLTLPISGAAAKDMHYDYVRASMVLKMRRIKSLKKSITQSSKEVVSKETEFDSESGYVIDDFQDEESTQREERDEIPDSAQDPYVTLIGTSDEQNEAKNTTESTTERSDSPRPPLFLDKHPNVAELDVESENSGDDNNYENIIIYEELGMGGAECVEDPHLYDSIHQMRDRVTRIVRGKHRKKLKKFIVKRKSNEQLTSDVKEFEESDQQCCIIPDTILESDSDSSDELTALTGKGQVIVEIPLDKSEGSSTSTRRKAKTVAVLRRRRTCANHLSQRQSLGKSDVLDKSQYDQMMEMTLNDQEVKQLQHAGAVKIKNIAELRAEIKQLVKNAPSVPPPLPANSRPRAHGQDKGGFKKWSSKSLRY